MHQNIQGKNVRITDNVRDYISDKTKKLKVHSDTIIESSVLCELLHEVYSVDTTISFGRRVFHSHDKDKDLYVAIDSVFHKIEREIIKFKEKNIDKSQRAIKDKSQDAIIELQEEKKEGEYHIVSFGLYEKPISTYDALFTFSNSKKHYFSYLPTKQSDDLYSIKVGHYPEFLFRLDDGTCLSISVDEDANFAKGFVKLENAIWSIQELSLSNNNSSVESKSKKEYRINEYNVGDAVKHLMNSDEKYIVYINVITDKPEALYREHEHTFVLLRLFDI